MKYCKNCILPDTRPNIILDENSICNACNQFENQKLQINWKKREEKFKKIVSNVKRKSKFHDCLIPVSGGKDSTWQVVKCLEYGLTPLALTWRTPGRTKLGQMNLDNLISLGVDHIDYSVSPKVESYFAKKSFERFGTPALPQHLATYQLPLNIAEKFSIPLIIWGENSALEYGGEDNEVNEIKLTENWISKYGVTHGTRASDWIDDYLTVKKMSSYFAPKISSIERKKIKAVYLGSFFNWNARESYNVAKKHGFKKKEGSPEVGFYNFADIDCKLMPVHHFLKWYKFGFTRTFDNLSLDIRNKKISRKKALNLLRENLLSEESYPKSSINSFCEFTKISTKHFYKTCEKFRNKKIWKKNKYNNWYLDNFIFKDWNWNANKKI